MGIFQSRNIALKNLQGEIVTFLDGDDYYYPKKLENEYLVLKRNTKFYAHDEKNECKVGDSVEITETRPLSKLKRWRISEIKKRDS